MVRADVGDDYLGLERLPGLALGLLELVDQRLYLHGPINSRRNSRYGRPVRVLRLMESLRFVPKAVRQKEAGLIEAGGKQDANLRGLARIQN